MGLQDRDYARGPEPGYHISAPHSATMQLLVATIGVYIVQLLFSPRATELLAVRSDLYTNWLSHPWDVYRLLSYGFAHDPNDVKHILFNMLVLGFFGRPVEQHYGRGPFLAFYLGAIVFAGIAWSASTAMTGNLNGVMFGASGGTTAIFILFALNFPRQEVRLNFIFPIPAWVLALFMVGTDLLGMTRRPDAGIAFSAHLAGAAFAAYYYWIGKSHAAWLSRRFTGFSLKPRPKLRVHAPDDQDDDLAEQLDVILQKIQDHGQDSLTARERRILEKASKKYQQRRR